LLESAYSSVVGLTFQDAIHITHGDCAGGLVRSNGATRVLVQKDLLTVGACDADPTRHRAARLAQWNITDDDGNQGNIGRSDLLAAVAALPASAPIVVWTSTAWSDRVALWWSLDTLAPLRDRLFIAQVPPGRHPLKSMGATPGDQLADTLANAAPPTDDWLSQSIELWRAYASPSPLGFDQKRRAGSRVFPELATVGDIHGGWFPRQAGSGLRLSELDELLLRGITHDFQVPRFADRILFPFGDWMARDRLEAWHRSGALERQEKSYRRTSAADALLADGLPAIDHAPRLYVGGCPVHDAGAPWARIDDSGGWHLEALAS
jgi:hypothetical protein